MAKLKWERREDGLVLINHNTDHECGWVRFYKDQGLFMWCYMNSEVRSCEMENEAVEMVERAMCCYPLLSDDVPCIGCYDDDPYQFGDTIGIKKFRAMVKFGELRDGQGHPIKDDKMDEGCWVRVSIMNMIPEDTTHIQWYKNVTTEPAKCDKTGENDDH